jgi:mannitol 2-dehydrogenase
MGAGRQIRQRSPGLGKVGVQFTDDVTPYEEMKIKLLNGSHLALTYLGF